MTTVILCEGKESEGENACVCVCKSVRIVAGVAAMRSMMGLRCVHLHGMAGVLQICAGLFAVVVEVIGKCVCDGLATACALVLLLRVACV